jgi:putative SOS response-associated peptidase YedK
MCSHFTIILPQNYLLASLTAENQISIHISENAHFPKKIFPSSLAPVVYQEDNKFFFLSLMRFGLIPSWSKEVSFKFATHNARLETVASKASFKKAFIKHHVFVPMTGFMESVYEGAHAGNVIEFFPAKKDFLYAAGIYDEWIDPNGGEIHKSFSIITHDPLEFVKVNGHDRSPIFLDIKNAFEWLKLENKKAKDLENFLLENRYTPHLETRIERPLKAGWEKRKKAI